MEAGLIYDPNDPELLREQAERLKELEAFNRLSTTDHGAKEAYMKRVFASCGENCYLELPFRANWGGSHVSFGNGIYANFNLTLVDDGPIVVESRVLFGPNVTVVTAAHPIDPALRERGLQYNRGVTIRENAWIGAGVTILPGVTIGRNSVIGAGSVVTRDIPDNVVAIGSPCRVLRPITERDHQFYDHDKPIDWGAL